MIITIVSSWHLSNPHTQWYSFHCRIFFVPNSFPFPKSAKECHSQQVTKFLSKLKPNSLEPMPRRRESFRIKIFRFMAVTHLSNQFFKVILVSSTSLLMIMVDLYYCHELASCMNMWITIPLNVMDCVSYYNLFKYLPSLLLLHMWHTMSPAISAHAKIYVQHFSRGKFTLRSFNLFHSVSQFFAYSIIVHISC